VNADGAGAPEDLPASRQTAGDEAMRSAQSAETFVPPDCSDELRPEPERQLAWVDAVRRLLRSPVISPAAAPIPAQPWTSFGRFELGPELGRGGCGVVFLAHDPLLGREVAVKVPRAEIMMTPAWRERFAREARAAAALDHPNIVPVYEAGEVGPLCFLVSAYCPGVTLAGWLQERREPVPVRAAAELVAALADAMAHAHDRGVLHRDLKPSNILLTLSGRPEGGTVSAPLEGRPLNQFVPRITDFGLAKLLQEGLGADPTRSGAILGTMKYMAPEQAAGKVKALSPATDVYALGIILYEVLIGRPPFQGESELEILRQVQDEEPVPPRRLRPGVPRDLETICLHSLNKEPARRYPTAGALGADLRRFLAGEPVRARPAGAAARLVRWCRRRPGLTAAVGVATLAVAAVVALSVLVAVVESGAAARLRDEQTHTQSALQQAKRLAADLALDRGLMLCERGEIDAGLLWLAHALDLAPPEAADLDHAARANLAAWYAQLDNRPRLALRHEGAARAVAISPDGRTLFTGGEDGAVRRWDATTGAPVGELFSHPQSVLTIALTPDGTRLAAGCRDGSIHLWDVTTERPCATFDPCADAVLSVAFSPDGRTLAAGGADGTVRLWDVGTGQARSAVLHHDDVVHAVAFSPDGKVLLTGCNDQMARLWDVASGQPTGDALPHEGPVEAVAISPDGTTFATGANEIARLWDLGAGQQRCLPIFHQGRVTAVAFCPQRHALVTGSLDGQVRFRDAATGKSLGRPLPHRQGVAGLALGPRGETLLVGCSDGTTWLWDLTADAPLGHIWKHPGIVQKVAFRPDGVAALSGGDGGAWLYDTATGRELSQFAVAPPGVVQDLAFSPGGQIILTGETTGVARLWDAATGKEQCHLEGGHKEITAVAISPNGRIALTAGTEGTARLWDVATGTPLGVPLRHKSEIPSWAVAFSPDSRLVLTGSKDRTAQQWDAAAGEPVGEPLPHPEAVLAVAFSPDGGRVLTGCVDGLARLWNTATGKLLVELSGHQGAVRAVAFNADGTRALTGSFDSTARLWDVATARSLGRPLAHQGRVRWVGFSPDGSFVLTTGFDFTARLWDAATGKPVGPPQTYQGAVVCGAFSPDGRAYLTASAVRTARLSPVPVPVEGDVERVRLWVQTVTGLELDEAEGLRVLDTGAWQECCRRLADLGGRPSCAAARKLPEAPR
jgi:WD40 repeat protein